MAVAKVRAHTFQDTNNLGGREGDFGSGFGSSFGFDFGFGFCFGFGFWLLAFGFDRCRGDGVEAVQGTPGRTLVGAPL